MEPHVQESDMAVRDLLRRRGIRLHDSVIAELATRAEVSRLRALAQKVLDALDAEKTPDYGVGHDRAVEAALAMLGQRPKPIEGRNVPLGEL